MDSSQISEDSIPFPSMDDLPEMMVGSSSSSSPIPEPLVIDSASTHGSPEIPVESHNTTSSSKLTSSDKLSALPPTNSNASTSFNRTARPAAPFPSANNFKRSWRRSLDAAIPLPAVADYDSLPSLSYSWGIPHNAMHARRYEPHALHHQRQGTPDHNSSGKETPRQRISTESDRASLPTMRSVGQAISRIARSSDPPPPSSPPRRQSPLQERHVGEDSNHHLNSRSPSQSKSRAASPLRKLHQWSSGFHRGNRNTTEEPFIPVDPFKLGRFPFCGLSSSRDRRDIEAGGSASSGAYDCDDILPVDSLRSFYKDALVFITDILPREIYLNFLLRLPALYFSRVARIFEDADVSRPDIQRMINTTCGSARGGHRHIHPSVIGDDGIWEPDTTAHSTHQHVHGQQPLYNHPGATLSPGAISGIGLAAQVSAAPAAALMHMPLPFPDEWTPAVVSPALIRFKHSWEAFIDSLLREWKTLNVVSALLASAILTIFQIPEAADDPLTRTFALLSLICALMSLSYGCIYIVRFGTMRSMFHASRWAEEAQKTKTLIWWNVWVLLATPAVWMAWSMLLFLSSILSFVWRTGSITDPADRPPLGTRAVLGPRIAITTVFFLGMIDLALIVRTLRSYGSQQNSVRALILAGSSGRDADLNVPEDSKPGPRQSQKTKQEAVEDVMSRRGRERERSTSTRIRHREEDVELEQWKSRRSGTPIKHNPKVGGLRGLLGFARLRQRDLSDEGGQEIELHTPMDSKINIDINVVGQ